MLLNQTSLIRQTAHPVILGAGLTGMAISRALSLAEITHVLVGDRPTATPRLGESLNAEGSLEIARQFPEHARFVSRKGQQVLFFGGHALSFDFIQYNAARAYHLLLDYPSSVPLLHVDRVGFDRALFETVIAAKHCLYIDGRAAGLQYYPQADRINVVLLASGEAIASTYVFDATNHVRFVARKLGVRCNVIGDERRVVFAHYRAADKIVNRPASWMEATSLLRLDSRKDPVDGLAWCIPLGGYVSVGISVDPERTGANPALLLDWVDKGYATRGIDVHAAFPNRGAPVDFRYEHYNHERCFGRNWLLTGPTCCNVWFPSATGVATGLVAARLAPDALRATAETAAVYQAYINQVAESHSMLEWLVKEDPWSISLDHLKQRSKAMIQGSVKRLSGYLRLQDTPRELAFGEALPRLYEDDRLLANPLRVDTALPQAQATRLFAKSAEPDPWMDVPIEVPVLSQPDHLGGPLAILGLVGILSGRQDIETSAALMTADLTVKIDEFFLRGVAQWNAWVSSLRSGKRVTQLELVPGSLTEADRGWILACQWRGKVGANLSVSPQFSITFRMAGERVATIETHRADYTFVTGDSILPAAAFVVAMGQILESVRG
jgi:flavin-dependent dehydrogenase